MYSTHRSHQLSQRRLSLNALLTTVLLGTSVVATALPTVFNGRWNNTNVTNSFSSNTSNTLSLEDVTYADGRFAGKFSYATVPRMAGYGCNRNQQEVTGTYELDGAGKLLKFHIVVPAKNAICNGYERELLRDASTNTFESFLDGVRWTLHPKGE